MVRMGGPFVGEHGPAGALLAQSPFRAHVSSASRPRKTVGGGSGLIGVVGDGQLERVALLTAGARHPTFGTMCNLYSLTRMPWEILRLFRVSPNRGVYFEPLPAIFPRTVAPVIRKADDGERELVTMSWGFMLLQKGYAPRPVTNVRDDKILTSPFWRGSFEERRCLVPASSYSEPDDKKPAGWHWFALRDTEQPRPLFAFPGIWRKYKGPIKKDGPNVEIETYSFMTTSPNELTATIMHDRMPVLLDGEEAFETWLSGKPEEAYGLVCTFTADRMRIVQSGYEKKDLLAA